MKKSKANKLRTYKQTYSGKMLDYLNPRVEDIDIFDIARGLAAMPRFAGHTRFPYTVAQHCLIACHVASPENKLAALLHDASETYTGDLPTPLKNAVRASGSNALREIEDGIQRVIGLRFGVVFPWHKEIKAIDLALLETERQDLLIASPDVKMGDWYDGPAPERLSISIKQQSPEWCYDTYLETFNDLYNRRAAYLLQEKEHHAQSGAVTH